MIQFKENEKTDGRTDRRTDGRMDGQTLATARGPTTTKQK